jgi:hypothetical protein
MLKDLKKSLKHYIKIFSEAQESGKKEADLVMYIVQFFKETLGYDVFSEISKEYQVKDKYCDIAIKIKGQAEILIEAKQPGIRLADRHIEQAENYAMKSGTNWVLLTNGIDWNLYHLDFNEDVGIERSPVFKINLPQDFQDKPNELLDKISLLQKRNYLRGQLDKYWKRKTMLTPQAISKALFSEVVLKSINREINRGAKVKVSTEDLFKALRNLLDKEILADIANIKIRKKRSKRRAPRIKKEPRQDIIPKTITEV